MKGATIAFNHTFNVDEAPGVCSFVKVNDDGSVDIVLPSVTVGGSPLTKLTGVTLCTVSSANAPYNAPDGTVLGAEDMLMVEGDQEISVACNDSQIGQPLNIPCPKLVPNGSIQAYGLFAHND